MLVYWPKPSSSRSLSIGALIILSVLFTGGIDALKFEVQQIKPGKTPGVKQTGDPSYLSENCKAAPKKLLDESHSLSSSQKRAFNRILLSKIKMRPPAWEYPHISSEDLKSLEALIQEYSNSSNFCPFLSRPCIREDIEYFVKDRHTISTRVFSSDEVSRFPLIRTGSWGSCAFIGLADTILLHKRGNDIDAHDTIIRLGEIKLNPYEEYVGSKTDITWIRRRAKMASRGSILKDRKNMVRMYIGHNNGIPGMPTLGLAGAITIMSGQSHSLPEKLYEMFAVKDWNKGHKGKRKSRSASTGFKDAIFLIFSKFCQRVDLYGFSSNCGGAYFNPRHLMQSLHNCELESWFLHHLMREYTDLNVCVHL